MAVVTPTDRPKSVRNRCVIEVFQSQTFSDINKKEMIIPLTSENDIQLLHDIQQLKKKSQQEHASILCCSKISRRILRKCITRR